MQETRDSQKGPRLLIRNSAKQHSNILKTITWIMAYAVWIFIFLIPIIGIILIVMYLLKNQPKTGDH
jgi:hypothetical protein